ILGEPNPASIAILKRQLYTNARAVPSLSGAGNHGYLGAIISPADYITLSGQNDTFIIPTCPALPVANLVPALTSANIVKLNRIYQHELRRWELYTQLMSFLKKQILEAIGPDYLEPLNIRYVGFANCQPINLLEHLVDEYGDSIACKCLLAKDTGEPISDRATITFCLEEFLNTGVYGHTINQWETKDTTSKIWTNFKMHFNQHEKACLKALGTSRQAGYHQANLLYTPSGLPINISDLVNSAKAKEPTDQADKENNNRPKPIVCQHCKNVAETKPKVAGPMLVTYCLTHGLTRAKANHTSRNCRSPADGHIHKATITNQRGGSTSIVNISGGPYA
ncbi:MAG: hypothetical protein SGBAC_009537, partial [Bacillariaceae sp.]